MILNEPGQIAHQCWLDIPKHFPNVVLHEHIIMPNHVHGIIELVGANNQSPISNNQSTGIGLDNVMGENGVKNGVGAKNDDGAENDDGAKNVSPLRSPSQTIGSIVRGFKIGVTNWFRSNGRMDKIWQRNYWERIIRDERSYHRISEYIRKNPENWAKDTFHHSK